MNFESELKSAITTEMERLTANLVKGGMYDAAGAADIRIYDRTVGGYHALRLVLEEFIPDIIKKINES